MEVLTKRLRGESIDNGLEGSRSPMIDTILENWILEEMAFEQAEEKDGTGKRSSNSKKRSFSQIMHVNNISKDPTKIRLPKMLKNDIRRQYPIMFVNMLNSGDLDLIELFFKTYTTAQSEFSKYIHIDPLPGNTLAVQDLKEIREREDLISLHALNDVINFVILLLLLSPDRIIQMKRSEIITRSDSFRTEINIYFELKGTRISNWTPIEVGRFLLSLKERHSLTRQELIEQFHASLPRMTTLIPLHVDGQFTLNIDNGREDLRISNVLRRERWSYL